MSAGDEVGAAAGQHGLAFLASVGAPYDSWLPVAFVMLVNLLVGYTTHRSGRRLTSRILNTARGHMREAALLFWCYTLTANAVVVIGALWEVGRVTSLGWSSQVHVTMAFSALSWAAHAMARSLLGLVHVVPLSADQARGFLEHEDDCLGTPLVATSSSFLLLAHAVILRVTLHFQYAAGSAMLLLVWVLALSTLWHSYRASRFAPPRYAWKEHQTERPRVGDRPTEPPVDAKVVWSWIT